MPHHHRFLASDKPFGRNRWIEWPQKLNSQWVHLRKSQKYNQILMQTYANCPCEGEAKESLKSARLAEKTAAAERQRSFLRDGKQPETTARDRRHIYCVKDRGKRGFGWHDDFPYRQFLTFLELMFQKSSSLIRFACV